MWNILLVDDHPLVTEGTKLILEKEGEFKVTTENQLPRLLERIREEDYDVMLFDLSMPEVNGIDLAAEVLKIKPEATILIYTGYDINPHLNRLIDTGVSGFISKTSTRDQLVNSIRCAIRKEVVIPIDVFRTLSSNQSGQVSSAPPRHQLLEHRDVEILNQIALGKGNREIAEQMCISQRSLEYSLTNIFHKLAVKSRIEAVAKAKDLGLLQREL